MVPNHMSSGVAAPLPGLPPPEPAVSIAAPIVAPIPPNPAVPVPGAVAPEVPDNHDADDTSLSQTGHLVFVTMASTQVEKSMGSGRSSKSIFKKIRSTKFDYVVMDGITRTTFIQVILGIHDLSDQYAPGVYSGPGFKIWWRGANGGKAGAPMIENDKDFSVALAALMKKDKAKCDLSVQFDLDEMDGFRIRKRPPMMVPADIDEELLYGTKVPRVEQFTEAAQLHGSIILDLKQKWPCQAHRGEHGEDGYGEDGYCYVAPNGEHIGLSNCKLKTWAAAIAAADATKHEPPNTSEFDSARDGRTVTTRARGRTGPHSSASTTPTPSSDASTMLVMAMLPLLTSLSNNHPANSTISSLASSALVDHTNSESTSASAVLPRLAAALKDQPVPTPSIEMSTCLAHFKLIKQVDMTASEAALAALEITPDILPEMPVSRLCEITGAVEGHVRRLQLFAKEWSAWIEEKRSGQ